MAVHPDEEGETLHAQACPRQGTANVHDQVFRKSDWQSIPRAPTFILRERLAISLRFPEKGDAARTGVSSIGDLGRLLEGLPRPLVDFLKVSAITRGAATMLGSTIHDRLRINATYALKARPALHRSLGCKGCCSSPLCGGRGRSPASAIAVSSSQTATVFFVPVVQQRWHY